MNSEALEPNDVPSQEATGPSPTDRLRALLDMPSPKDEAWQSDAGRAVATLAVGFLNEPDDCLALRSVALLGLASSLGVKEARKRALKLTRWAEVAPPPLAALAQRDEQQAAMTTLARLSVVWSRPYIEQCLRDRSLPDNLVPDLLRWALSTYADRLSYIREFYAPQVAAAQTLERTEALLRDAPKLLKPTGAESARALAEGTAAMVDALVGPDRGAECADKGLAAGVSTLLHLVQGQVAAAPAVLMQPSFVVAFGRLAGVASDGSASKQVAAVANTLALATMSLLAAELERYGSQAATHWRAMVPAWRAAYVNWDACYSSVAKHTPGLATLDAEPADANHAERDLYETEAAFARLLPAWSAFVAELPDASRAASLTTMLEQSAATLGIAPLGETGAVVSYDPLSHHLTADDGRAVSEVRILRAGVQVRRPDGSVRVLLAALVEAV